MEAQKLAPKWISVYFQLEIIATFFTVQIPFIVQLISRTWISCFVPVYHPKESDNNKIDGTCNCENSLCKSKGEDKGKLQQAVY